MPATHDERVHSTIDQLVRANRDFSSVPAPHEDGDLPLSLAYEVQRGVYTATFGTEVGAYKVSLVAPEHRANFGAKEPTFGRLPAIHVLSSPVSIPLASMFCPLVEPELMFLVEADLPLNASIEAIQANTRVAAGMEIPDSRLVGWSPVPGQTVSDLVADASFAGRLVVATESVPAATVDLAAVTCQMFKDGELVGEGVGSNVMDDPINAVAWLSQALAREGEFLRAGTAVSAGTFFYPPQAEKGTYEARYSGIGSVSATFS